MACILELRGTADADLQEVLAGATGGDGDLTPGAECVSRYPPHPSLRRLLGRDVLPRSQARQPMGGGFESSPLVVGGRVFAVDGGGQL